MKQSFVHDTGICSLYRNHKYYSVICTGGVIRINITNICTTKMSSLPWSTLVATVWTAAAALVFGLTACVGCTHILDQYNEMFVVRVAWLVAMRWLAPSFGLLTALVALCNLHVSWKRRRGPDRDPNADRLCSAGVSECDIRQSIIWRDHSFVPHTQMIIAIFALLIMWLLVLGVTLLLVMVERALGSHCSHWDTLTTKTCLNVSEFRFMYPSDVKKSEIYFCKKPFTFLKMFCQHCESAASLLVVALAACALIVLGLVHHLMCLAVNHAHHCNPLCARRRDVVVQMQQVQQGGGAAASGNRGTSV